MPIDPACSLCLSQDIQPFAQYGSEIYLRCNICDLTFMHPKFHLSKAEERERYLLHENDPNDDRYREFLDRLARPMIGKLSRSAQGLDYGAGPGPTLSVMMKEKGFSVDVYDPHFSPNDEVFNQQYDFVTCSETAEHFYKPSDEFHRFQRLLKPGGWLGVMTDPMIEKDQFKNWHYRHDPTHVSFYSLRSFEWIAKTMNWTFEQAGRTVFLFQKHHD